MEQLLIIRETIINFYKRYETFLILIIKFFTGVYIFNKIHAIGYLHPDLLTLNNIMLPLTLLLGVAFAVLPASLSFLLMTVATTLQYSANIEIAAVIFLFLVCVLLFYVRMAPKESMLILATIIAFHFKIPYLIPLLAGLYFSLTAILPITIGVFIYAYIPVIQRLTATAKTAGFDVTEMPTTFTDVYTSLLSSLTTSHGWLFNAFIFAMVIIIVYVISRLSIDFAKEIAIGLGCVLNIFGYIMAVLIVEEPIAIFGVILLTLLCGALALLVRFMDGLLDYQRAESVQFEDEHNFYYVRVIPKVIMSKRKRVVRRIRPPQEDDD